MKETKEILSSFLPSSLLLSDLIIMVSLGVGSGPECWIMVIAWA